MPNIKSAKKRVKTNRRNELRNRAAKSAIKSALKAVTAAAEGSDPKATAELLRSTQALVARTWKRGIIHKNKAARLQSRMMRRAAKAKTA